MRRFTLVTHVALLTCIACSIRTQSRSEAGREFAVRLCAVQNECNCAEDLLIPDCEDRVEQGFAKSESKAKAADLVFDPACMESFLDFVDDLGTCEVTDPRYGALCPVYVGDGGVGESCEVFDIFPRMQHCRLGLSCIEDVCRDLENPTLLPAGAICAAEQSILPTSWLGTCDEGLQCDSLDTRTCIPVMDPLAALGEECTVPYCLDNAICRPQGDDLEPSEERPGICVERTPPGEPCTVAYECDRICEDGLCQVPPPVLCEALGSWWTPHEDS